MKQRTKLKPDVCRLKKQLTKALINEQNSQHGSQTQLLPANAELVSVEKAAQEKASLLQKHEHWAIELNRRQLEYEALIKEIDETNCSDIYKHERRRFQFKQLGEFYQTYYKTNQSITNRLKQLQTNQVRSNELTLNQNVVPALSASAQNPVGEVVPNSNSQHGSQTQLLPVHAELVSVQTPAEEKANLLQILEHWNNERARRQMEYKEMRKNVEEMPYSDLYKIDRKFVHFKSLAEFHETYQETNKSICNKLEQIEINQVSSNELTLNQNATNLAETANRDFVEPPHPVFNGLNQNQMQQVGHLPNPLEPEVENNVIRATVSVEAVLDFMEPLSQPRPSTDLRYIDFSRRITATVKFGSNVLDSTQPFCKTYKNGTIFIGASRPWYKKRLVKTLNRVTDTTPQLIAEANTNTLDLVTEAVSKPADGPNSDSFYLLLETFLLVNRFVDLPIKIKLLLVSGIVVIAVITVLTIKILVYIYKNYVKQRIVKWAGKLVYLYKNYVKHRIVKLAGKLAWVLKWYKCYRQIRVRFQIIALLHNTDAMIFIHGLVCNRWRILLAIFILQHILRIVIGKKVQQLKPEQIILSNRIVCLISTPGFKIAVQIMVLLFPRNYLFVVKFLKNFTTN